MGGQGRLSPFVTLRSNLCLKKRRLIADMASLMRSAARLAIVANRIPSRTLHLTPAARSEIVIKYEEKKKLIEAEVNTDVSVLSGVPEEQVKTRRVRIFVPAKNAMQSGTNKTKHWQVEFDTQERWEILSWDGRPAVIRFPTQIYSSPTRRTPLRTVRETAGSITSKTRRVSI